MLANDCHLLQGMFGSCSLSCFTVFFFLWWMSLPPASSYPVHHGHVLTKHNTTRPTSLTAMSDNQLQHMSLNPAIPSLFYGNHLYQLSQDGFHLNFTMFPSEQPVKPVLTITNGILSNENSDQLFRLSSMDHVLTDISRSPQTTPLMDLITLHHLHWSFCHSSYQSKHTSKSTSMMPPWMLQSLSRSIKTSRI